MATVTKKRLTQAQQFTSCLQQQVHAQSFRFETNASGVFVDSSLATAVQVNDIVRIGILLRPAWNCTMH